MKTTLIKIDGMTCEGCVASATKALHTVSGVRSVDVNLARGNARVEHGDEVDENALVAAVTDAGYDAHPEGSGAAA